MKHKLVAGSLLLMIMFATLVLPLQADGGVQVSLTPSREQLAVGDPVELTLEVTHPAGYQVIIPKLDQSWGPFEVRGQSQATTSPNDDGTETTRETITVTLFELGSFDTPTLPLTISDGSGQVNEQDVPPLTLTVNPLRAEGDTALRDIRPQAELAVPSMLPAVTIGLVVAAVAAGSGWWLYRRWRLKRGLVPVIDNRPPYQVAYAELDRIAGLSLPEKGQFKQHYTLITDCLRAYLEQQFKVHAFDRTTSELNLSLKQSAIVPEHSRRLVELFRDSDLVKFAKFNPEVAEAYQSLEEARTLVTLTKPPANPTNAAGFEQTFGSGRPQKPAEVSP